MVESDIHFLCKSDAVKFGCRDAGFLVYFAKALKKERASHLKCIFILANSPKGGVVWASKIGVVVAVAICYENDPWSDMNLFNRG